MLSENQIVTVTLSVVGGIFSAVISACGIIWALIKFFLDIRIEKSIENYDKNTIQVRCKDHKAESRDDLQEIKDSQKLSRDELREEFRKIYNLIGTINQNILDLAIKK